MTSNVRGAVVVRQNGVPLPERDYMAGEWVTEPSSSAVTPYSLFEIPTYPLAEGDNVFDIAFYPAAGQSLASADAVRKVFVVRRKAYFDAATPLYVSPTGSSRGAGTGRTLSISIRRFAVLPGRASSCSTGSPSCRACSWNYNDGLQRPQGLVAENRTAIIDFQEPLGFRLRAHGEYWTLEGFHVRTRGTEEGPAVGQQYRALDQDLRQRGHRLSDQPDVTPSPSGCGRRTT